VLVAKYAWHLPLYPQTQMPAAQGLDIKRAILAFWVYTIRACTVPIAIATAAWVGSITGTPSAASRGPR
jgi:transposase